MTQARPGVIRRLFGGLWDAVNFTRRLLVNLVFLLILLLFFAALFGGAPTLQENTALEIAPNGNLVEQYSSDPVERSLAKLTGDEVPEVQLRDLVRAIDAAAKDARIERILLRPDGLNGAGFASLREVAEALKRFRAAGKEVVAYADWMDQRQYYLAAYADEIYLNPQGLFWLEGLASYRSYFREALQDKLGVDVHLFRAGAFKSAAEPYILDSASAESRESTRFWLNDVWQRYLADISAARGLDAVALQADIDQLGQRADETDGDLTALALKQGLVDELLREDEVEQRLIERGAEDDGELRKVDLDTYLGFVRRERLGLDSRPQIAVVVAQGDMLDGEQPPGTIGGTSTAELIREAREDEEVKALVLRVDSPGGSAFAAEQIRRELQLTRDAGKPVLVSMGDVAASGGYWIALGGDRVFADPSTITGSIGVYALFMTFPDTLAKIGVRVDGVATSAVAGGLDPRRPLNPEVGRVIQSAVDKSYRDFLALAAEQRKLSLEAVDAVAQGRVWSGAQALERGLVDQLGGFKETLAAAAEKAGLPADGYRVRYVEAQPSPFERFLLDLSGNARVNWLAERIGLPKFGVERLGDELQPLLRQLHSEGPRKLRLLSHCFCEL